MGVPPPQPRACSGLRLQRAAPAAGHVPILNLNWCWSLDSRLLGTETKRKKRQQCDDRCPPHRCSALVSPWSSAFRLCAMMRRADRGEGRITHGDDTRDGESLTRGPRAGHDKRRRAHTLHTTHSVQMMRSCSLALGSPHHGTASEQLHIICTLCVVCSA